GGGAGAGGEGEPGVATGPPRGARGRGGGGGGRTGAGWCGGTPGRGARRAATPPPIRSRPRKSPLLRSTARPSTSRLRRARRKSCAKNLALIPVHAGIQGAAAPNSGSPFSRGRAYAVSYSAKALTAPRGAPGRRAARTDGRPARS